MKLRAGGWQPFKYAGLAGTRWLAEGLGTPGTSGARQCLEGLGGMWDGAAIAVAAIVAWAGAMHPGRR